jgi:hypothetical protein
MLRSKWVALEGIRMPVPSCLAGAARVDITPAWPVMQGGFGQRTTPSEGVLDRIHAKALYLRGAGAAGDALLLVTADLIAMPRQLAQPVLEEITRATGLEPRQVCICASHTHSGPVPFDAGGAPGVAEYSAFLRAALVDVAQRAIAAAQPARLGSGVGSVDLFLNRRTRGAPNRVDPRVAVLRACALDDGRDIAVLFGVGCHPVTLGWDNMRISGDFPGVAQHVVEDALDGAVALFFNSTEGNVIPVTSPNLDALDPRGYHGGSHEDAVRIGTAVASEVLRVLPGLALTATAEVGSARRELSLPARNAAFDLEAARTRLARADAVLAAELGDDFRARSGGYLWALASRHVLAADCSEDDMRRLMIACCEHLGLTARVAHGKALSPASVPVQVLRMHALELLALPGEVLVEVGQAWSAIAGHDRAFIVGLANAHLRYLPAASHFAEPEAGVRYETVTAGLEAGGVERALDAAGSMLAEVRA